MGLGVLFAHQLDDSAENARPQIIRARSDLDQIRRTEPKTMHPRCAPAMHTSADFLRSMRQTKGKATQFGVYVRGETPTAVRLQVPFFTMENAPQITPDEHENFRARIRARYSAHAPTSASILAPCDAGSSPLKRQPPDDIVHSTPSKDW